MGWPNWFDVKVPSQANTGFLCCPAAADPPTTPKPFCSPLGGRRLVYRCLLDVCPLYVSLYATAQFQRPTSTRLTELLASCTRALLRRNRPLATVVCSPGVTKCAPQPLPPPRRVSGLSAIPVSMPSKYAPRTSHASERSLRFDQTCASHSGYLTFIGTASSLFCRKLPLLRKHAAPHSLTLRESLRPRPVVRHTPYSSCYSCCRASRRN